MTGFDIMCEKVVSFAVIRTSDPLDSGSITDRRTFDNSFTMLTFMGRAEFRRRSNAIRTETGKYLQPDIKRTKTLC